ncbi:MAG: hypothetical protein ACYDEB_06070 [Dehalococcoidia bacterium]
MNYVKLTRSLPASKAAHSSAKPRRLVAGIQSSAALLIPERPGQVAVLAHRDLDVAVAHAALGDADRHIVRYA